MGPNTLSGHLSVIYTTECQINFAMRIIRPLMRTLQSRRSILPSMSPEYDVADVKATAERRDIDTVQEKAKKLVWASGCSSWFIHSGSNRNTIMFPDWQFKFWLKSVFISWDDFSYRSSEALCKSDRRAGLGIRLMLGTLVTGLAAIGISYRKNFMA